MIKKLVIFFLITVALGSITYLSIGIKSTAEECEDPTEIPTAPDDVDYCTMSQNNPESEPVIQASSDEIEPEGYITLNIKSGSLSHPPYNWSVSSTKYTLDKSTTVSNPEIVTMTAASGTCSSNGYNNNNVYVTVTVTDNCGITSQATIRNTVGLWISLAIYRRSISQCVSGCSSFTAGADYYGTLEDKYIGGYRWHTGNSDYGIYPTRAAVMKIYRNTTLPSTCRQAANNIWRGNLSCEEPTVELPDEWATPNDYIMDVIGYMPTYDATKEVIEPKLYLYKWACP